jgi:hypothetical protein
MPRHVQIHPLAQVRQRGGSAATQRRQRVFDTWRNFGENGSVDQPSVLHPLQGCRQHLRADSLQLSTKFSEPLGTVLEHADRERRPLVCEQVEHLAAGARGRVDVVAVAGVHYVHGFERGCQGRGHTGTLPRRIRASNPLVTNRYWMRPGVYQLPRGNQVSLRVTTEPGAGC